MSKTIFVQKLQACGGPILWGRRWRPWLGEPGSRTAACGQRLSELRTASPDGCSGFLHPGGPYSRSRLVDACFLPRALGRRLRRAPGTLHAMDITSLWWCYLGWRMHQQRSWSLWMMYFASIWINVWFSSSTISWFILGVEKSMLRTYGLCWGSLESISCLPSWVSEAFGRGRSDFWATWFQKQELP